MSTQNLKKNHKHTKFYLKYVRYCRIKSLSYSKLKYDDVLATA